MRNFLAGFALACNMYAAGPVLFGVRGGAPIETPDSGTGNLLNSSGVGSGGTRFQVGPTVGVRLPLGFSIEGDALFSRRTLNIGQFAGFSLASLNSDWWEFPVMLKYTAGHKEIAPQIGAGISVQHINGFNQVTSFLLGQGTATNTAGFVASGGVRWRLGPVDVTPEIRYTRWGTGGISAGFVNFLPMNRNEVSALVGITF